jgi:hypothetical protein
MDGNENYDTAAIAAISREAPQTNDVSGIGMVCSRQSRENGPEVRDGRGPPEIAALSGSIPKAPGSAGGYLLTDPSLWSA